VRVTTVPFWETREPREGELLLRINVGKKGAMAFGFGAHPTTRNCVAVITGLYEEGAPRPRRVLDVGCGSGLLSIACARLGAEEVLGVDIDATAVALAAENAERNGAAQRCRFELTPPGEVPGRFDLVVANLPNSEIIRALAPALCERSRSGLLFVTGYGAHLREAVVADLQARRRKLRSEVVTGGWGGLLWK
jgi:ribosomal protein L11 methyltransferase